MVDYDDFLITMPQKFTYDDFVRYIVRRVDRAIASIEALVKAALHWMRPGSKIIVLVNSLWTLALTESAYHDGDLVAKNRELMEKLSQEVCLQG